MARVILYGALAWAVAAATDPDFDIYVQATGGYSCSLAFQGLTFQCSLGRNGVVPAEDKVEGDGSTPAGAYPIRRVFYRADRVPAPNTYLEANATRSDYGWCDDSEAPTYNEFVYLPTPYSHEDLYLNSSYYDLLGVIGYNDDPPVPGKGSAIFFHVTPDYGSTSGCVAMHVDNLTWVLSQVLPGSKIHISAEVPPSS